MQFLTGKVLVVAGFLLVLLIGIPATIYLVQQQQDIRSRADQTSVLSAVASKTTASVGEEVPVDIMLDPGKNFVTYLNVEINYDKSKLSVAGPTAYDPNAVAFPIPVQGPTFTDGKIVFSLQSSATDVTRTIRTKTKVATIKFKTLAPTDPNVPAFIRITSGSQAYSAGGIANGGANDRFDENVLSQLIPANITILGGNTPTLSPTQPVLSTIPTQPPAQNQLPTCTSFVADRSPGGTAPFDIALTASGSDTDGQITRVTMQYGDGPATPVSQGGGIGTNSVSLQAAHTYHNPGTYQAYALLTDDKGGVSAINSCQLTITVTAPYRANNTSAPVVQTPQVSTPQASGSAIVPTQAPVVAQQVPQAQPQTALPPTGPEHLVYGIGALAGGISLVGMLLFFAL